MISNCLLKMVHSVRPIDCVGTVLVLFTMLMGMRLEAASKWVNPSLGDRFVVYQDDKQESGSSDRIATLIQDLGSESYPIRASAHDALIEIGEPALPQLLRVASDVRVAMDLEIQMAAQTIVREIQDRLSKTFADSFRAGEKTLPGWDIFSKRYGDSKQYVELYATMYEANSLELDQFAERTIDASTVSGLVTSTSGKVGAEAVGRIATSMFLATEMMSSPIGNEVYGESHLRNLLPAFYRSNIVSAIKGSSSKQELLHLLDQMLQVFPDRQVFQGSRLRLYSAYQESSFLNSMIELAHDREQAVSTRIEMISAICGVDEPEAERQIVEALVALFDDRSSVGRFLVSEPDRQREAKSDAVEEGDAVRKALTDGLQWTPENARRVVRDERLVEVEVRDVALAAAIIFRKLSLEDFGMPSMAMVKKGRDSKPSMDPRFAGFSGNDQRVEAFEKWNKLMLEKD